jgi:hypothetical protein
MISGVKTLARIIGATRLGRLIGDRGQQGEDVISSDQEVPLRGRPGAGARLGRVPARSGSLKRVAFGSVARARAHPP